MVSQIYHEQFIKHEDEEKERQHNRRQATKMARIGYQEMMEKYPFPKDIAQTKPGIFYPLKEDTERLKNREWVRMMLYYDGVLRDYENTSEWAENNSLYKRVFFEMQDIIQQRENDKRVYLLHKGRMLYDARFINEHIYQHDRTSIDHLPAPIKNRIDDLPRILYPTEGLSAVSGRKIEITDSETLATQEILHQVWSMKNQAVFGELLEYI